MMTNLPTLLIVLALVLAALSLRWPTLAAAVVLVCVALLLGGCATATVSVPLGSDARYGRIVVGYEPPPCLYALAAAPVMAGVAGDFKEVRW